MLDLLPDLPLKKSASLLSSSRALSLFSTPASRSAFPLLLWPKGKGTGRAQVTGQKYTVNVEGKEKQERWHKQLWGVQGMATGPWLTLTCASSPGLRGTTQEQLQGAIRYFSCS